MYLNNRDLRVLKNLSMMLALISVLLVKKCSILRFFKTLAVALDFISGPLSDLTFSIFVNFVSSFCNAGAKSLKFKLLIIFFVQK
jgi:hypothetical protein